MADQQIKQIKIKTGVLKRLTKEKGYYEKEAVKEQERYDKFKSEGADDHVLNKQIEVINESKAMVPDTRNRLIKAKDELKAALEEASDQSETQEYQDAQTAITEALKVIE